MREEIFGPVLPLVTYGAIDEAIAYINARPRPLAAYYFGDDENEQQQATKLTTSGALVLNAAMTHVFFDALPFGGVGASGMGYYHGEYGFRALSHAKPVVRQSANGQSNRLMRAPYLAASEVLVENLISG